MKPEHRPFQRIAAFLTIFLILAYISVAFLPHTHAFCETDCALCRILHSSREILAALTVCAFWHQAVTALVSSCMRERALPIHDATLVNLKVKLSD